MVLRDIILIRLKITKFNNIKIKRFPKVWFDFRIALQGYIDFKKLFISKNYLTYYQQSSAQASSNFKRLSLNWWIRRKEAHNFTKYLYDNTFY